MQVEANRPTCPSCGATRLSFSPVIHHMLCAYVGPQYDFADRPEGLACPKCRRVLEAGTRDAEIVGTSARCAACGAEMMVAPAPAAI